MLGSVNPKKDQDDILKRKYQVANNLYGNGGEAISRGFDKAKAALGSATYGMPQEPANAPYSFESGSNVAKTTDIATGLAKSALQVIPNRGATPGPSLSEIASPNIVPDPDRVIPNTLDPDRVIPQSNPLDMGKQQGPAFAPYVNQPTVAPTPVAPTPVAPTPVAPLAQKDVPLSGQALTSKLDDNMSKMDALVASGGASPEQLERINAIKAGMARRTLGASSGQGLSTSQRLGGIDPTTQVRANSGNLQFEGPAGDAAKFTNMPAAEVSDERLAQHDFNQGLKSGRTSLPVEQSRPSNMSQKDWHSYKLGQQRDETARNGQALIRRGQDIGQQVSEASNTTTLRGQDNTFQIGSESNSINRSRSDSLNESDESARDIQGQAFTRSQNEAGAEEALRQAYASGDPEAIARAIQQRDTYRTKAPKDNSITPYQQKKLAQDERKAENKFVVDNQMSGLSREELIRQYRMQTDPVSQYLP